MGLYKLRASFLTELAVGEIINICDTWDGCMLGALVLMLYRVIDIPNVY